MGHLSVSFDNEGVLTSAFGNPVLMDSSIEQDPIVLERVNQVKKITDKYFEEVRLRLCNGKRLGFWAAQNTLRLEGQYFRKDTHSVTTNYDNSYSTGPGLY